MYSFINPCYLETKPGIHLFAINHFCDLLGLKTELLDGGSFSNLNEARLEISHYLVYYKAERWHSAFGYFGPNHFETQFQTASQHCAA